MSGAGNAVSVVGLLQLNEQTPSVESQEKMMSCILPLRDKILTNSRGKRSNQNSTSAYDIRAFGSL